MQKLVASDYFLQVNAQKTNLIHIHAQPKKKHAEKLHTKINEQDISLFISSVF
jgi:hypothetical protein